MPGNTCRVMGSRTEIDRLVARLLSRTKKAYGDDLVSFVLFGSVARGVPRPDSDIDILIVADNFPSGRMNRVAEFEEEVEKPVEKDVANLRKKGIYTFLSPIFKTREEVLHGSPLFLDMIESSKILFDRDEFFKDYLKGLRKRMKELGSRKVKRGNAWYWILKPDYKEGDIIEL